jgi:hypothetical protein
MDLLSCARPVASRVIPQVIDLTIDSFDDVLHKLLGIIKTPTVFACRPHAHPFSLQTSPADDLLIPGAYPQSTILRRPHLRFQESPALGNRKPTLGVPQPLVESVQQPTAPGDPVETCSSHAPNRTDTLGVSSSAALNPVKNAPVNYAVRFSGPVTALREKSKIDRPLRLLNSRVTPTPNKSL